MRRLKFRLHRWRYALNAYRALPITFVRRVLFGRDPYWRQYFWSRWGYPPKAMLQAIGRRQVLWIDALSGGEVTQTVTFCRMLREASPALAIVLSTNNRYSHEFAKANLAVDYVFDSPWDCPGPVRRVLRRINPTVLVCVESLTSPILVREAKRMGITTVFVSALMSKDIELHPMYHRIVEEEVFGELDWIGVKSQDDVRGFVRQGAEPERVVVTGNMKFDLEFLQVSSAQKEQLRAAVGLSKGEPVLLAASVHLGEEELVADAYLQIRQTVPALRLVLVPRYRFHVAEMTRQLDTRGLAWILKSSLRHEEEAVGRVVVVDTFGELAKLYAIATVVFLGGSTYCRNVLGLGQNIIEPLVHRRPIFFGPFMHLWPEITKELKSVWEGFEVKTARELASGAVVALTDSALTARLEGKIDEIMNAHRNDVGRNVELVRNVLPREQERGAVFGAEVSSR